MALICGPKVSVVKQRGLETQSVHCRPWRSLAGGVEQHSEKRDCPWGDIPPSFMDRGLSMSMSLVTSDPTPYDHRRPESEARKRGNKMGRGGATSVTGARVSSLSSA